MTSDKDIIVRTVTVFIPPSFCRPETNFRTAVTASASHARALQAHLATYGITVQTVRISVPSPSTFGPTVSHALRAASILDEADVDYANLGMIYPDADADENDGGCFVDSSFMYNVIRLTKRVSLSISLTSKADSGMLAPVYISQRAVKQAAIAVKCISKLDPAGFSNLRFGAAANVRPNGPFFPASYAGDDDEQRILRTALGVQGATFLQSVISDNKKKSCLYEEITQGVEKAANRLIKLCKPVAHGVSVDFSTAPFPDVKDSIGDALTKCSGVSDFPSAGGLSVAARFADAIDRATFRKAGFCGIMLPVSEDVVLARCAPGLNDLLVCSAVCGTGLDTVPVAGEVSTKAIEAVMKDVASLSQRLGHKQLTVRLMPVPGKRAGEKTAFTSPYMSNGPVIEIDNAHFVERENEDDEEEEVDIAIQPFQRR